MKLNEIKNKDCINYLKKIEDNSVNLIVVDPPYNELPKDWDNFNQWNKIKKDFYRILKNNGQLYIFGKQPMLSELYFKINDLFEFRFELIWNKGKGFWNPTSKCEMRGMRNVKYETLNPEPSAVRLFFCLKPQASNLKHSYENPEALNPDPIVIQNPMANDR